MACGVYQTVDDAVENMVRFVDVFEPNPETAKIYNEIYHNVYMKLYKKLQPFYLYMDKNKD